MKRLFKPMEFAVVFSELLGNVEALIDFAETLVSSRKAAAGDSRQFLDALANILLGGKRCQHLG